MNCQPITWVDIVQRLVGILIFSVWILIVSVAFWFLVKVSIVIAIRWLEVVGVTR